MHHSNLALGPAFERPPLPAIALLDRQFTRQLNDVLPAVRRFALRLCNHRAMAEDMTQEAVMRGWAARAHFTPDSDLRAWLCVILRNCYYTTLKRERRNMPWDPDLADQVLVSPPNQENSTLVDDVAKAMLRLPLAQREALMLVAVEGLSHADVARQCGCALGTVKSRLARGRQALLKAVNGHIEGDGIGTAPD